jgi:hypothetical protein
MTDLENGLHYDDTAIRHVIVYYLVNVLKFVVVGHTHYLVVVFVVAKPAFFLLIALVSFEYVE